MKSHNETAVVDVEAMEVVKRFPVGQAPKRIFTAIMPQDWEGDTVKPALINITSVCALSLFLLACSPEQNSETPAAPSAADTPRASTMPSTKPQLSLCF